MEDFKDMRKRNERFWSQKRRTRSLLNATQVQRGDIIEELRPEYEAKQIKIIRKITANVRVWNQQGRKRRTN